MEKISFDRWNEKKKEVHFEGRRPHFFPGEIWWAYVGQNVATEIIGKGKDFMRPVVIIKVVYGNACIVIPLSSRLKEGDYYCSVKDAIGDYQRALLPQIKYLDGKRLKYKKSHMTKRDFESLLDSLINFIKK